MAQDDIYRIRVHYQGPTMAASISLYYQEDALSTAGNDPVASLAFSFFFSKITSFQNVLNNDWRLTAIRARRLTGERLAPDLQSLLDITGNRAGNPLPANNCLLMKLSQSNFPRTSNGRLYLPGLSESDTVTGVLEPAFLNNQVETLGIAITAQLPENGGSGSWNSGVISAKVRDSGPGQPDWESAFSPINGAQGNPVIARQVRRTTRVIGVG